MPSVLLISGTSHVGKSTLAAHLGQTLGWSVLSTDKLGRHPGRPWPDVRPPVEEFYSSLTDDTIYWFLRVHHENIWPVLRQTIEAASEDRAGLILEGSALRPEFVADLLRRDVLAVGLFAPADFLRDRMKSACLYAQQDGARRLLIDKFIARSLRDNSEIAEAAGRLGLELVNVGSPSQAERLVEALTVRLRSG